MESDGGQLNCLKNRDPDAWRAVYHELGGDLFGYAFHLLRGNRAIAEEIVQAAWLRAIEVFHQFDPNRGTLRNWLFAIVRQSVVSHYRQQGRRSHEKIGPELAAAQGFCDDSLLMTPPEVMEHVERQDVVRAAMLCLPKDRREVLVGKYVDGLSVAELAASTGRTEKSIESLLSRARTQMRELLGRYFEMPR